MVFPNISISVMECFKVPIVYVIQTKGALNSSFPSISQNITMNRYTKNARYRISFLYNFNCNNINTIVRTTPRSHPVVLNIIIILGINRVNAVKKQQQPKPATKIVIIAILSSLLPLFHTMLAK